MQTEEKTSNSESQARAQLVSIVEMVAHLSRGDTAKLFADGLNEEECLVLLVKGGVEFETVDLDELREIVTDRISEEAIDDPEGFEFDEDKARETILEDAMSVQVRSGWYSPHDIDLSPAEFEILLCTGGPACRIIGDLDRNGEPSHPRLQHQDWFKPWTELVDISSEEREALQEYCRQFLLR